MTRIALTGTIGAAVLVVALGLFYAVYQQDQDDPGDGAPSAGNTASTGGSDATGAPDASGASANGSSSGSSGQTTQTANTGGAAPAQPGAGGEAAPPPSFDVVRVNPSGDAVIAGRAEPEAEVIILDQGKPIGSVRADDRGEWVFLPDTALKPGEHTFTLESKAEATEGAAEAKQESETSVVVLVPEVAKDIAGRTSTQPAGALAIEVPKSGEGPTRVLNVPGQTAEGTVSAASGPAIAAIDYDAAGKAILSGRAPSGARLFVYVDNKPVGEAVADEDGLWIFTPTTPIEPGLHVIRIDQVDETGKVIARAETPFEQATFDVAVASAGGQAQPATGSDATTVVASAPATGTTAAGGRIVVQPGNSLWKLARDTYGQGVQYTVIYEANKDQIANPDLIYPGQVFSVPGN